MHSYHHYYMNLKFVAWHFLILSFRFIQPCRSLCVAVRDSCAPVLACQGHPWPEALDCDRFPAEEDMCLSPHAKFSHFAKGKDHRLIITMLCSLSPCFSFGKIDMCLLFWVAYNYCTCPKIILNYIYFFITELPKPACQRCPSVEEAPAMKTVLDAFCQHDFGKFLNSFRNFCNDVCRAVTKLYLILQPRWLIWFSSPQL